jgi:hypothetical protein
LDLLGESPRYKLSFTSGALYLPAAPIAARLYQLLHSWAEVREALRAENLLQARTGGTSVRWSREIVQRMETLTDDEVALLLDATSDEIAQIMWAATCRHYDIIAEFAEEVLRERFLLMHTTLSNEHFDEFVNLKRLWHEELSEIQPGTYLKLRSNLFKMLREGGLIDDEGTIIPSFLSLRLHEQFALRAPSDMRFFPVREAT